MQEIDNPDNEFAKFFENWTSGVFSTSVEKCPKPLDGWVFKGNNGEESLFSEEFVD